MILGEVPEEDILKQARDTDLYNKAGRIYGENGLAPKPETRQEKVLDGKGLQWGAEILASDEYVGAPRKNLAQLMCRNLAVLANPWITWKTGEKLMGS